MIRGLKIAGLAVLAVFAVLFLALWTVLGTQVGSRWVLNQIPGLTVDTHFGRLVRRFGWTDERDPAKVEAAVATLLPKAEWTIFSHRVIFHGRRVCHARRPACGACALAPLCPSYGVGEIDPVVAVGLVRSAAFFAPVAAP